MKKRQLTIIYLILLMLAIGSSSEAFSQTNVPTPTCAVCGGKNGVHSPSCQYYNPPAGAQKSKTPGNVIPGQVQQLNMLIDLFNTTTESKEVEAQKEAAIKEALETKLREESLRKARHDREMKTFKSLDGNPSVAQPDANSGSGLSFKPLPSGSAPMTQEERERQNILRQNSKVTWNYDDFANVSPNNQIPEPTPEPELSDEEKLVNNMIAKVEENGGRVAAVTGRFILNIKDGVMSYLDDAAYAVTSGNSYVMQETGEMDVRKITTNALYKTATQTAKAYYENAKETVTGDLKDKGIGVMRTAAIDKLEEYKYFDHLSKAWQQIR